MRSNERPGVEVVMGNVRVDGRFQFGHAGEALAPDALVGDFAEEARSTLFNHNALVGVKCMKRGVARSPGSILSCSCISARR